MSVKENLVSIIREHQSSQNTVDADSLADTIINELLREEWMVADLTENGSIDGGSMYEEENAEEEARAYYARVATYAAPPPQKLLHRKVTAWEPADPTD